MDTLTHLLFDLQTYCMSLIVDLILYGLAFNLKYKFKWTGNGEWKSLKDNI